MQRCASVCASWDNKSVEPQQSHEKNISGMQFVQWELILRSTLSDNFRHRKCRWDCGIGMRLMRLHFSVPRNYVMSPFLWEPSESVSCPVFGLTLRILASRFSSLGFVFLFLAAVYVHCDFTHAVNEVFVFFEALPKVLLQPTVQNSMRTMPIFSILDR